MAGQENTNYFKILPFHGVTVYDIECEYTSIKKKLLNIMNNDELKAYLKENEFEELFNPSDSITCQYYDENEFISSNRNGDVFYNIFSMNIRIFPKHGGEIVNFRGYMEAKFGVIIMTEIGARNLSALLNLFPKYNFHHVWPHNNNCPKGSSSWHVGK